MSCSKSQLHPRLRLYRINTGSCNGCDVELAATAALARFGLSRLGCSFTEEPAQADLVLITGPLTLRSRDKVLEMFAAVPEPKVTIAVGVCPISGGVFRDSYALSGPLDDHLPVDVNIPGCPPRPQAVVAGVAEAVRVWRAGHGPAPREGSGFGTAEPGEAGGETAGGERLEPSAGEGAFPERKAGGVRGRMSFRAEACVGCRMCEHVCAAGAIRFEEQGAGLQFTLWHNSCAFCGLCSHYCPTKALSATGEWQLAHLQGQKYLQVERGRVAPVPCSDCGAPMLPVAPELLLVGYRAVSRDTERLGTLCTECRQVRSIKGVRR